MSYAGRVFDIGTDDPVAVWHGGMCVWHTMVFRGDNKIARKLL